MRSYSRRNLQTGCFLNLDRKASFLYAPLQVTVCRPCNSKFRFYENVISLLARAFIHSEVCTRIISFVNKINYRLFHYHTAHTVLRLKLKNTTVRIVYIFTQRKLLDGIRALNWKEFSRGRSLTSSARTANSASSSRSMTKSRFPISVTRHMFSSFIRERTNISSVKRCSSCASGK